MGRVTDKGISGLVGTAVFYIRNGKNYVRTRPKERVKKRGQKPNPLNTIFGDVSRYGSCMQREMNPGFLFPLPLETRNRFRSWLYTVYTDNHQKTTWDISTDSGSCQLSGKTEFRNYLKANIAVTDRGNMVIAVGIPEINPVQHLKAPAGTKKVTLKFFAASSPFEIAGTGACSTTINFDYNENIIPAQDVLLEIKLANPNDITIIAIAIEYEVRGTNHPVLDLRWLPAAVVAIGRLKK